MMRNNLWIHGGGSPYLWGVNVPYEGKNRDYMRRNVLFSTLRADWRTDIDYDGFDWSSAVRHPRCTALPAVTDSEQISRLSQ